MDDFTLFDDDHDVLRQDFLRIQQLLGQFGLNVNPSKTFYNKSIGDVEETLSALHESLVEIVDEIHEVHGASGVDFVHVENEVATNLNRRSS